MPQKPAFLYGEVFSRASLTHSGRTGDLAALEAALGAAEKPGGGAEATGFGDARGALESGCPSSDSDSKGG